MGLLQPKHQRIRHGVPFYVLPCSYQRCIDAGAESVMEPQKLEEWPVTAAFVKDPDRTIGDFLGEVGKQSGSDVAVVAFERFKLGEAGGE